MGGEAEICYRRLYIEELISSLDSFLLYETLRLQLLTYGLRCPFIQKSSCSAIKPCNSE